MEEAMVLDDASPDSEVVVVGPDADAHNAQLPIHSIPWEILASIFWMYTRDGSATSEQIGILRLVCRTWRHIALATPALWAKIGRDDPPAFTPIALERSQGCPLDLEDYWRNWDHLEEFVRRRARWRIVCIRVAVQLNDDILPKLFESPLLEELRLIGHQAYRAMDMRNCTARSPRLRLLELWKVAPDWDSALFSRLQVLRLYHVDAPEPSVRQLHAIVSNCPELQEFCLDISNCSANNTAAAGLSTVKLSDLVKIDFFMPSQTICTFLPLLSVPNARDIRLTCHPPDGVTQAEFAEHATLITRSVAPHFTAFCGIGTLEITISVHSGLDVTLEEDSDSSLNPKAIHAKVSVGVWDCPQSLPLAWLAHALGLARAAQTPTVLKIYPHSVTTHFATVADDLQHFNIKQLNVVGEIDLEDLNGILRTLQDTPHTLPVLEEILLSYCLLGGVLLVALADVARNRRAGDPAHVPNRVRPLKRIHLCGCDLTGTTREDIKNLEKALGGGALEISE